MVTYLLTEICYLQNIQKSSFSLKVSQREETFLSEWNYKETQRKYFAYITFFTINFLKNRKNESSCQINIYYIRWQWVTEMMEKSFWKVLK